MPQNPVKPELPDHFRAHIDAPVQHRVGDGMLEELPLGQDVQVDVAMASMVLSWESEGQPVTVALARDEFFHYVEIGAIRVLT